MNKKSTLTTVEVRWFFQGKVDEHPALKNWFGHDALQSPQWQSRKDVYLVIAESNDLGIKWREGQIQIKGLVASAGQQSFGSQHQGRIEHWIKWSYENLPTHFTNFFTEQSGVRTVSIHKIRALRKIDLTGMPKEVEVTSNVDRAIEIELTDIKVAEKQFCTLGFEAYPDDSAITAAFTPTVESFLTHLKEIHLSAAMSQSYPVWISSLLNI